MKLNVLGLYALNGQSVVEFKEDSKKESFASFLYDIRRENPWQPIMLILDNYSTHKARLVRETARLLGITLVYLPPYSPDLNPIELVWKSLKRVLSPLLYHTREEVKAIILDAFYQLSNTTSFAHRWIEKILSSPFNTFQE
jgi:transposase